MEAGRKIIECDVLKDVICNYKRYLIDANKTDGVEAVNHILEMLDRVNRRVVSEVKPGWWLVCWDEYDTSEQARNSL